MTIRPKQGDIDLLNQLIDMRDSAHLAGHTSEPFRLFEFNGSESILFGPGRSGGADVSTNGMSRLQDLGVLRVVGVLDNGYSFDLVDDIEDRREEMRVAAGQPSRMGELQASVARAEAATTLAEAGRRQVEADSARARERRSDLRALFAHRVGRWVLWFARIVLGTLYIGAVVLAGYFVSANLPVAIVVAVIGVSVVLAALDWLLHIDGFALAATLESRTVKGLVLWLESFDPE